MSALRASANVIPLHDGIVEGDPEPLIAEGTYHAVYVRHDTVAMRMFGGAPKVFVHCRIVDPGEAFGVVLYRCYRVKALTSKPGRRGTFRLAKRSDLFLTLHALTPAKLRPDRISLKEVLGGRVLVVKVRTVKSDYQQRPLPPALHYSVLGDISTEEGKRPAVSSEQ